MKYSQFEIYKTISRLFLTTSLQGGGSSQPVNRGGGFLTTSLQGGGILTTSLQFVSLEFLVRFDLLIQNRIKMYPKRYISNCKQGISIIFLLLVLSLKFYIDDINCAFSLCTKYFSEFFLTKIKFLTENSFEDRQFHILKIKHKLDQILLLKLLRRE